MITQIFSITNSDQALMCAKAGVNHVGIRVGNQKDVPWELSYEEGKNIVNDLKGKTKSVIITASNNIEEIYDIAFNLRPDIMQTLATFEKLELDKRGELRDRLQSLGIEITNGLPLLDESSIEFGKQVAEVTDMIILETVIHGHKEMGATGQLNNWDLAKSFVNEVNTKVIMSGGLGPDNVKDCILKVKPWGVDSMTKTDVFDSNHMQKDIELVKRFVSEANSIAL